MLETERFRGREEREQRTLVLRHLGAEERPQQQRGDRMQRGALVQQLGGHASRRLRERLIPEHAVDLPIPSTP